jgi:hypothetical protein
LWLPAPNDGLNAALCRAKSIVVPHVGPQGAASRRFPAGTAANSVAYVGEPGCRELTGHGCTLLHQNPAAIAAPDRGSAAPMRVVPSDAIRWA